MTHQDCERLHPLLSLYVEDVLDAGEKEAVTLHLAECGDARAELEDYRTLMKTFASAPEPVPPADLHEKILHYVYERPAAVGGGAPARAWWSRSSWWGVAAAAVGVVLFFNLFSEWRSDLRKATKPPTPSAVAEAPAAAPQPVSATAPAAPAAPVREEKVLASVEKRTSIPAPVERAPKVFKMQDDSDDEALGQDTSLFASQVSRRALQAGLQTVSYGDSAAQEVQAAPRPAPRAVAPRVKRVASAKAAAAPVPVAASAASGGLLGSGEARTWGGDSSPFPEQHVEVVKDSASLETYWLLIASGQPVPQVDFTTENMAFICLGTRPTSGYRVQVEGVSVGTDAVTVLWRERAPGSVAAQVETHPWAMQALPKTDKPVVFIKR